jgi:prevent-host-death family protein
MRPVLHDGPTPVGELAARLPASWPRGGCDLTVMCSNVGGMRFGLVGTGYWARVAHAPALARTEDAQLTAVWGRNPRAAADLAAEYGATAHQDVAAFLAEVDAVSFAVPPDVQVPIATQAARDGKHLLLEKPIALTEAAAYGLVEAVEQSGVASVVFFTGRFQPEVRAWLAEVAARGGWQGGVSAWLGSAWQESNPFNTPWRRDKGGLWDVGPHIVSLLWASLGPVTSVTADHGPADVTHLVLHHQDGATSTTTVTLSATEAAAVLEAWVWGESGRLAMPADSPDSVAALSVALSELLANARAGQTRHPCDVWFGRDVVRVLADAQRQLDARRCALGFAAGRFRSICCATVARMSDNPERDPRPVSRAARTRNPGRPAARAEAAGSRAAASTRIGIRELRQHASVYVDLAEKGYTVDITNRGRLVAQLVPVRELGSPMERLIAAGIIEPAEEPGGVAGLDPYPAPAVGQPLASEILGMLRRTGNA